MTADPTPGSTEHATAAILGVSPVMRELLAQLDKLAASDLTCMITGETGTGKELVARAIHSASARKHRPFVVLDCGAIPRDLVETTLFGHEKGSFTGAAERHRGCFEQADGGTIFLDEIGELDPLLQPKLLRVLERREITRVGGARTFHVNVRVLAATHRDLRAAVQDGLFRHDLYFRLSVMHLSLPPLRQRPEDIPLLARHFLSQLAAQRGATMSFHDSAIRAMQAYPWPGNVRELRNVVERALTLSEGAEISHSDLVFAPDELRRTGAWNPAAAGATGHEDAGRGPALVGVRASSPLPGDAPALFAPELFVEGLQFKQAKQLVVNAFEVAYLEELMKRNGGNISRAAAEAGLTRYHLRELLRRHHLLSR